MTADDIRTRLDAIDAYCAAATEGPWWRREGYAEIDGQNYAEVLIPGPVTCGSYCYGGSSTIDGDRLDADLAFIAAARTDLPAVVAALRDALAEVEGQTLVARQYEQERDAARDEVERWVDAHAVLAREVDELRRALSVDDLAAHDEARAEELAPRITAAMLGAYGLGRDDEAAGNPVRTPLDIVENSLPADVPILGSDDPGAAQWERCDALVADLRLLCDDYDLDPRPAFGAVPVWRLRRLLDRHGPAVVPMSSDRGHDLRWGTGPVDAVELDDDEADADADDIRRANPAIDKWLYRPAVEAEIESAHDDANGAW